MRIQRRTIFASTACVCMSVAAIAALLLTGWSTVLFGIALGVCVCALMALILSANVYFAHRQSLMNEMFVLILQIKGVCIRIAQAESMGYGEKVDLLLQSYHSIKNSYSLLIRYVLDFDPLSRNLARRVVLLSEEVHMLETRLKDQLRMNAPLMKKTYADLVDSLPLSCIESMECFIARRVLSPRQREAYRTTDSGQDYATDVQRAVASAR